MDGFFWWRGHCSKMLLDVFFFVCFLFLMVLLIILHVVLIILHVLLIQCDYCFLFFFLFFSSCPSCSSCHPMPSQLGFEALQHFHTTYQTMSKPRSYIKNKEGNHMKPARSHQKRPLGHRNSPAAQPFLQGSKVSFHSCGWAFPGGIYLM